MQLYTSHYAIVDSSIKQNVVKNYELSFLHLRKCLVYSPPIRFILELTIHINYRFIFFGSRVNRIEHGNILYFSQREEALVSDRQVQYES